VIVPTHDFDHVVYKIMQSILTSSAREISKSIARSFKEKLPNGKIGQRQTSKQFYRTI
jgi:hypothetical protein